MNKKIKVNWLSSLIISAMYAMETFKQDDYGGVIHALKRINKETGEMLDDLGEERD